MTNTTVIEKTYRGNAQTVAVSFTERESAFVYDGARGIVITQVQNDRAGALVEFVDTLRNKFGTEVETMSFNYGKNRLVLPRTFTHEVATEFLGIIDMVQREMVELDKMAHVIASGQAAADGPHLEI